MFNEKTIILSAGHITYREPQKIYYKLAYRNQAFSYHSSSQREACIQAIITRAQFNSIFVISDLSKQPEEAELFTKLLRLEINKTENQSLNLRIKGDPEPANKQDREKSANEAQKTMLETTTTLLTTFPWSIFSGLKAQGNRLSPKETLKKLKAIKKSLKGLSKASLELSKWGFVIGLIGLCFLTTNPLIIIAGACIFVGAELVHSSISKMINHLKIPTYKLSDDFVNPELFQAAAPTPLTPSATAVISATPPTESPSHNNPLTPPTQSWSKLKYDI